MKIPNNITKMVLKDESTLKELMQIILFSLEITGEEDIWIINKSKLILPIKLNNEELSKLIKFFFIYQYNDKVSVDLDYSEAEIKIIGGKVYKRSSLILKTFIFTTTICICAIFYSFIIIFNSFY